MKFLDSFWKASFYKDRKATSFWRSFGKVTLVTGCLSVIYAICIHLAFGMHIPAHLYSFGVQAVSGYPSGLTLTIGSEGLSKNLAGELSLYPIRDGIIGDTKIQEKLPGYVISINENEKASSDVFAKANALVLLAKDGVVVYGDKEIQILSYQDLLGAEESAVISKDMIVGMVSGVNTYAKIIPWILFASVVILHTLFAPVGYLILGLFNGLVIMLLSVHILKKKTGFKASYILGMYALAPVIIVTELLLVIPYIKDVATFIFGLSTFLVVAFLWLMFRDTTKSVDILDATENKKEQEVKEEKMVAIKDKEVKTTKEVKKVTEPKGVNIKKSSKNKKDTKALA